MVVFELIVEQSVAITLAAVLLELGLARSDVRLSGLVAFLHTLVLSLGYGYYAYEALLWGVSAELGLSLWLLDLSLRITPLAAPVILITCIVAPFISLYSVNYLYYYKKPVDRFYPVYSATLLSVLAFFSAGDFITLLVAMEAASVLTGLLVAYKLGDVEVSSALKYIYTFIFVGKLAFAGAGLVWAITGSIELPDSLAMLGREHLEEPRLAVLALLLLIAAFATKATLAPMSFWLIWAMDAPSNVSALFHFGIIILMGVYGLLLTTVPASYSENLALATGYVILLGGALAALIGSAFMLVVRDVKHLVGLSTIENAGITAVCIGGAQLLLYLSPQLSAVLLLAALLHSLAHAYSKAAMFMNAGCLVLAAHSRSLDDLSGLSRFMPATGALTILTALTLVGLPPSLMFASTILILASTLAASLYKAELLLGFAAIVLAHVFSSIAYIRLARRVLLDKPEKSVADVGDDALMLVPQAGLMALSFITLALLPLVLEALDKPIAFLGLPRAPLTIEVAESFALAAVSLALVIAMVLAVASMRGR